MLLDVDYSGQHATPGSREWIITRRSLLLACLSDIKNNRMVGQKVYGDIKSVGGWRHLQDLNGKPFRSFKQFCESPNGLGLKVAEIERRLTAQEMAASNDVPPLAKHGGDRNNSDQGDNITLPARGTSKVYLVAKLKRDAPEFAEQLAAGEFRSARACALAAGIIEDDTAAPKLLRRGWKRATPEERAAFLAEVAA